MIDGAERYLRIFADHFALPLFTADPQGRIRPLNRAGAERIGGDGDGLLAELLGHNGRRASERVRGFLREIARDCPDGIAIRRFDPDGSAAAVHLVVLSPQGEDSQTLVMVLDAGICTPLDADVLMRWFGLTTREAEVVARIAAGYSLSKAARELGISVGTARNHLKAAFHKSGISGQARLAALVGVLGPFLRSSSRGARENRVSRSGHARKAEAY